MSPAYTKLEKKDADICRAFQNLVKQGKFDIQGEALPKAGLLFKWFCELDKKIEETLNAIPGAPIIRQLTEDELSEARADLAKQKKAKK